MRCSSSGQGMGGVPAFKRSHSASRNCTRLWKIGSAAGASVGARDGSVARGPDGGDGSGGGGGAVAARAGGGDVGGTGAAGAGVGSAAGAGGRRPPERTRSLILTIRPRLPCP